MRLDRHRVVVATLAICLLASVAPSGMAQPRPLTGPRRPVRALAVTAERLASMGMPRDVLDAILDDQESDVIRGTYVSAIRAGDLDGDGRDDVFSTRVEYEFTIDWNAPLGPTVEDDATSDVLALDGRSGDLLWKRTFNDFIIPLRARLGEKARPAALLISGLQSFLGPIEDRYLVIDARDGGTGRRLWRYRFRTVMAQGSTGAIATGVPLSLGLFNGIDGRATDILVGVGDEAGTFYVWTTITQAVVLEGSDGTRIDHLNRYVGVNWSPTPDPTGDLDGDGLDDYVITQDRSPSLGEQQELPSIGGMALARRGIDGTEIFSEPGFEFFWIAWTYDVGDVTGDGKHDLGIVTSKVDDDAIMIGGVCFCDVELATYLVDGRGSKLWRRAGAWPYSPGDIDNDGHDDVVTDDFIWRWRKGAVTLQHDAHNAKGTRLWHHLINVRYDTSLCNDLCGTGFGAYSEPVGDTDMDAIQEAYTFISIQQDGPAEDKDVAYITDGKSGRRTLSGDEGFHALGASMDGRGTDLVVISSETDRIVIEGRDGNGGSLWKSALEGPALGRATTAVDHVDLDGDRCADVLVSLVVGGKALVAALSGGSGRVLWSRMIEGALPSESIQLEDHNPTC